MKDKRSRFGSNASALPHLTGYGMAITGVALTTALIQAVPGADHTTNISLLYLLTIMATAYAFGSGPSILAALLAVLTFDWFLVEPRHTLTVNDPAEWLALSIFLVTAIVISQLTHDLRLKAEEARQRERETAALSQASWAVASQISHQQTLVEVLRQMAQVVGSDAAALLRNTDNGSVAVIASYENGNSCLPDFYSEKQRRMLNWVEEHRVPTPWGSEPYDLHPPSAIISTCESKTQAEKLDTTHAIDGVYLPLVMEQRVLAVLYLLQRRDKQRILAEERRVVESLANLAAVVLERHRLAEAEAQAKALVEADRLKTALLSMVSHDFRSPLTAIKASVTGLLQEGLPWNAAAQRELLSGIDQETDRLSRMVGEILALSRLEAGAWHPQRELVSVTEVVGAALDGFNADENRRIRVTMAGAEHEVLLDSVQIVQVLYNLIENALKYSPEHSMVELGVDREDDQLKIEVLDQGYGLPAGEEERIFERFYRAERWRESSLPGSGMGLAICRGLIEAHGGQLTATNRATGGAIFQITLPLYMSNDEHGKAQNNE